MESEPWPSLYNLFDLEKGSELLMPIAVYQGKTHVKKAKNKMRLSRSVAINYARGVGDIFLNVPSGTLKSKFGEPKLKVVIAC